MEIGFIPEYLKNIYAEFSPVDNVAEAVVKATEYAHDISVLHVYNQNHVYITDLIEMLPNNKVKFINNNEFYKILQNKLNDKNNNLIYLANDLDENKKLVYESKIKIKNDFSKEFFEKIGFKWSNINKSYIKKILDNI